MCATAACYCRCGPVCGAASSGGGVSHSTTTITYHSPCRRLLHFLFLTAFRGFVWTAVGKKLVCMFCCFSVQSPDTIARENKCRRKILWKRADTKSHYVESTDWSVSHTRGEGNGCLVAVSCVCARACVLNKYFQHLSLGLPFYPRKNLVSIPVCFDQLYRSDPFRFQYGFSDPSIRTVNIALLPQDLSLVRVESYL